MDPRRFDRLVRRFAARRHSRRDVLAAGGAGLVATVLGAAGLAEAQEATPPTGPGAAGLAEDNATLFVQTAASGSFRPNPGAAAAPPGAAGTPTAAPSGAHLLVLRGHSGQTIAFSDRPQRRVGEVETPRFLDTLGFTPANPPNAALVVDAAHGGDDVLVVELMNPAYDAATQTLIYEAEVLQQYRGEGLEAVAVRPRDGQIAPEFGSASLFIDDCPDLTTCYLPDGGACSCQVIGPLPGGSVGQCWHWGSLSCTPCNGNSTSYYATACDNAYAACGGSCLVG